MYSRTKEQTEKKVVALGSIFAALFLTGFKLLVGMFTGSLGILSEALHSGLDMIAALMTFFAVRWADKPPDSDHHYGHGKIENFSALIETFLLLITCVWIIYEGIDRITFSHRHIIVSIWSYLVVITSIIIDLTRSKVLMKVSKKYKSQALEADAIHFSSDIFSSLVVLIGLIGANFNYHEADSIAALVVAALVVLIAFRLGKRAVDALLDKIPSDINKDYVREIAKHVKGVTQVHNIRIRTSGAEVFINLNIHVAPEITIQEAHGIAHNVEDTIKKIIPKCTVDVHAEPEEAQSDIVE